MNLKQAVDAIMVEVRSGRMAVPQAIRAICQQYGHLNKQMLLKELNKRSQIKRGVGEYK
jgi:DNA-binding transcriptional regulator YbjK